MTCAKYIYVFPFFYTTDSAFIMEPKQESVPDKLSGEEQVFTCVAGGSDPTIIFYHNGAELPDDMDGIQINGGTLTIESTNTGYSGMYQCIVENDSGSDGTSWYLIVRDPSEWSLVCSLCISKFETAIHNFALFCQAFTH